MKVKVKKMFKQAFTLQIDDMMAKTGIKSQKAKTSIHTPQDRELALEDGNKSVNPDKSMHVLATLTRLDHS